VKSVLRRLSTIAILIVSGLAGCGDSEEGGNVKLVKVTGTITDNGKPLEGVLVSFVPAAGNPSFVPATGESGSDGSYTLYSKNRTGVAPGKYKVTVAPAKSAPEATSEGDILKNDPSKLEFEKKAASTNRRGPAKKGAPPAPTDGRSEFEAEVKDGDGQILNFDTKDALRPAKN
jgi:hypothetical protein